MVYKKLCNEELSRFKYPNLIAELIESGYSICTLADHMGLEKPREQDDPEVWAMLRGEKDITASQGFALARLFNVKYEYLFQTKLNILCEKPLAYLHWYEWNKKMQDEEKMRKELEDITKALKKNPQLRLLFKDLLTLSADQI